MTSPHRTRAVFAFILTLLLAVPALAHQPAGTAARGAAAAAAAADAAIPRDAEGRKILTLASYGEWNRITSAQISADGRWLTYAYSPLDGTATLYIREVDGPGLHEIAGGAAPSFSDDGRWVAYTVAAGGSGAARGAAAAPASTQPQQPQQPPRAGGARAAPRTLQILNLATGAKADIPGVASFTFSPDSRHLLARRPKANSDAAHDGADLVLRELATGATQLFGNVGAYALNERGSLLAYVIDAQDRVGNGVFVYDVARGTIRPLRTAAADFAGLTWNDAGSAVAFLHGETRAGDLQRSNALVLARNLGDATPRVTVYEPADDPAFPRGYVLSEFTAPRWTKDGTRVFIGIRQQEPAPPRAEGAQPNVDVWHWRDDVAQSVQEVRAERTRRTTLPAVYNVAANRFVQLGDDDMPAVQTASNGGRYGVGRLDAPYRAEVAWGTSRADFYRVDLDTGERALIAESIFRSMGMSPNGEWYLFLENGSVYAKNLNTLQATNLSERAGVNFVNLEDDYAYELPAYGVAGWSSDGRQVLLNHRYDIYAIPLAGGQARNLTGGVGTAERIRFRITNFDAAAARGRAEDGVDLSRPITLTAFGERTKRSGYYELRPGGVPQPLVFEDRSIGGVQKAENSDRIIYTQQTFTEFPDYWVADTRFRQPRRVTDANPQLAEYAWSPGRVIIDYTDARGNELQGTLALPAGYEPGRRYPMLVYFYDRMSDQHHRFQLPAYDDRPHPSTYASDGYLVLQPDIVYTIGRPGTSALDAITSAVRRVIELGYADPDRIGLQGHSWGGYQSSYIVTQTDMFAAVVTGAPVTNLVSFYGELYKSSGTVQQGIMEVGQVRMGRDSTPWSARAQYMDQSPLHNAEGITTPFLILHGTADGAVDYHQGLEFFNAARRLGKEVILLSYPDEPHHLARRPNQEDFQIRMKQYFDHYLRGAPAPRWMTDGVPFVRKHIERPVMPVVNTAAGGGAPER
jgi:dipeptidyl aminopeptidase/acylaminoacyl peptidase